MAQEETESRFKLITWNINGLGNTLPNIHLAHKSLESFFKHLGADAVCLQEVKMPESKRSKEAVMVEGWESIWACSQPPKTGYSGVTTYVNKRFSPTTAEADSLGSFMSSDRGQDDLTSEVADLDKEGRCVITDLVDFVLLNVYVPNAGDRPARARLDYKCRFLEALRYKMDALRLAGREIVLVGDLNVAPEKRDVHPSIHYDQLYDERELQLLHSMTKSYPDVWRLHHPDTDGCYTVWEERTNARQRNAGLRLDYVLVTPGLLKRVTSCEIMYSMPPKWSDHAPICLELAHMPPIPAHPPCALSSERDKRFHDRGQAKISSLFAAAPSSKKGGRKQITSTASLSGQQRSDKTGGGSMVVVQESQGEGGDSVLPSAVSGPILRGALTGAASGAAGSFVSDVLSNAIGSASGPGLYTQAASGALNGACSGALSGALASAIRMKGGASSCADGVLGGMLGGTSCSLMGVPMAGALAGSAELGRTVSVAPCAPCAESLDAAPPSTSQQEQQPCAPEVSAPPPSQPLILTPNTQQGQQQQEQQQGTEPPSPSYLPSQAPAKRAANSRAEEKQGTQGAANVSGAKRKKETSSSSSNRGAVGSRKGGRGKGRRGGASQQQQQQSPQQQQKLTAFLSPKH